MNTQDINQEVQPPSDYLLENHKALERLNDFDEMCEELDALQHEAMQYAFQDGFNQGEINVLRQFVDGMLDLEYVKEWLEDYDRELEDNTFRLNDAVTTKYMYEVGFISKLLPDEKAEITWCFGSIHESKTVELICNLIKA